MPGSTSERLHGEIGLLERDVVLDLLEHEPRTAAAVQVVHDHFVRGPDPLYRLNFRRLQPANQLFPRIRLDLDGDVIILADPENLTGILRGPAGPGNRLDLPRGRAVNRLLVEEGVLVLARDALFEILEAEIGAEESRGSILQ